MGAGMLPGCCARAPTRLGATEHTMGLCLDGVDDARLTAVGARRAQAAAIAPQAALLPAAADGSRPLAHEFNRSMRVCCMAQRRCPSGGCRRASRQSGHQSARHSAAAEPRACSDARRSRGGALLTTWAVEAMAAAAMSDDAMGKALWDAAEAGNTGEVTRLLKAGAPVNWAYGVSMGVRGSGAGVLGSLAGPAEELVNGGLL